MKKSFARIAATALVVALCAFMLIGCGGYDVKLPIGDGSVENDSVIASFHIDETITDGYVLKGEFSAESGANLNRNFVLSICNADPRFTESYKEHVLTRFSGSDVDGKKLGFTAEFPNLSDAFEKTDAAKNFYIVLRVDSADFGFNECNASDYSYTFDGKTLKISK